MKYISSVILLVIFVSVTLANDLDIIELNDNRNYKSLIGAATTLSCSIDPSISICDNGICPTIESCMNTLTYQVQRNPTAYNSTVLVIPNDYYVCPTSSYSIPNVLIHVYYQQKAVAPGFQCDNQFLNAQIDYPTDIVIEGLIFNSQPTNNPAPQFGGTVYVEYNGNKKTTPMLSFLDVLVMKSQAVQEGGFAYSQGFNVAVTNSFIEKSSAVLGGAIYTLNNVYIINSNFESNNAQDSSGRSQGVGGAIYGQYIFTNQSLFTSNSATLGGALYGVNNHIYNSEFKQNKAHYYGGAIASLNYTYATNSLFEENFSNSNGGAIDCQGFLCYINGSTFISNTAGVIGGSIHSIISLDIYNSVFNLSTANTQGGAIASSANTNILQSQFHNNKCPNGLGGAVYLDQSVSRFYAIQSLFDSNSAGEGGAVLADHSTILYFYDTVFQNNDAQYAGAIFSAGGYPDKLVCGRFINNNGSAHSQTFNEDSFSNVTVVFVSSDLLYSSNIYVVPLVLDANGARAFGVYGPACVNGVATINTNGLVLSCTCNEGWSGPACNVSN